MLKNKMMEKVPRKIWDELCVDIIVLSSNGIVVADIIVTNPLEK